ncbi:glycosyl transferase family 2 [Thermococcus chitonophagus]|uniref:Glycosyl transferase family 2 n=1 Tax=Thermococcus chitonophagus TaxID=54262 RepID=A0A160VR01_9EURY|nr:glycosyltransferase family 2 protein [Thermococcus chitonophagus]ASJ16058.1 glycosyl transferase family 2 [Thermococcus chitonophagus]CUX77305.1 glycosyl transferase family 2 [Thermococcus chitonophagus]
MNTQPLVSVIVPTYKRKDKLRRLLESLLESDYPKDKLEIIVVVDADGEDYGDLIKEFPRVRFIFNKEEKFVAESRNVGIRNSHGDYIFVIDDDNIVDRRCISELVKFMENNPRVGIAGPIMYYYKDPHRIWCAGIKRNYYTSLTRFIGRGEIDMGQFSEPLLSEDFPNAFMIRREVIDKIGYFDSKNFPIHYEEADFCRRASIAGYEIYTVPTAKVWHDVPLPEEIKEKARFFHVHNEIRAYYAGRNRVIFHKKYSKRHQLLVFILIFNWIITAYYLMVILFGYNKRFKTKLRLAYYYLRGIVEGLKW